MGMLALLVVPRVVLAALAEPISVPPAAPSPCELAGATWSYMAPEDFEGVAANNEAGCLYAFEPAAAGGGFNFSSPAACRGDSWKLATGAVSPGSAGRQVLLTFSGGAHHTPPISSPGSGSGSGSGIGGAGIGAGGAGSTLSSGSSGRIAPAVS